MATARVGVSRADGQASRQRRDSAETTLLTVSSFGFAIIDNATSIVESLGGEIVVGIARDALVAFYSAGGNAEGKRIALELAEAKRAADLLRESRRAADTSTLAGVIAAASHSVTPRGYRFELLRQLSMTPCRSAWRLLAGREAAVDSAFARARREARFESEVSLIDMIEASPERSIALRPDERPGLTHRTASLAAMVLRMPRLRGCTEALVTRRATRWPKLGLDQAIRRTMQDLP